MDVSDPARRSAPAPGRGLALFLCALLAVMTLVPLASAGFSLRELHEPSSGADQGRSVAYDPTDRFLASSFADRLVVQRTADRSVELARVISPSLVRITDLVFSPDGTRLYLAFANNTESRGVTALSTSTWAEVDTISAGSRPVTLSAARVGGGSGAQLALVLGQSVELRALFDLQSVDVTLAGEHSAVVTCVDFTSDGERVVTGDSAGELFVWWRINGTVERSLDVGSPITGCEASPDGAEVAWSGGVSAGVVDLEDGSTVATTALGATSRSVSWVHDGAQLAVLTTANGSSVAFVAANTGAVLAARPIGHRVEEIAWRAGTHEFATATYSGIVALYADGPIAHACPTVGADGPDNDEDGIPNDCDGDADGDGIPTQWDTDVACIQRNRCHLQPDHETIRHVLISIGVEEAVIRDTQRFNLTNSELIRILADEAVVEDGEIDDVEAGHMRDGLCGGFDPTSVSEAWRARLDIGGAVLQPRGVLCQAADQLRGRDLSDARVQAERVTLTWTIRFAFEVSPVAPYTVQVEAGAPVATGSAADAMPAFPMLVQLHVEGGTDWVAGRELWRSDLNLSIEVAASPDETPSVIERGLSWALDRPALLAVSAAVIAILVVGALRLRNRSGIAMLDIDFDDDDDVGLLAGSGGRLHEIRRRMRKDAQGADYGDINADAWVAGPAQPAGPAASRIGGRAVRRRSAVWAAPDDDDLDMGVRGVRGAGAAEADVDDDVGDVGDGAHDDEDDDEAYADFGDAGGAEQAACEGDDATASDREAPADDEDGQYDEGEYDADYDNYDEAYDEDYDDEYADDSEGDDEGADGSDEADIDPDTAGR